MSEQARRGRRKSAEKHAAVLAAAKRLFFANGVEGVAIEHIAAEAGVSKMMIYSNFKDKEGVFESMVSELSQGLQQIVGRISLSTAGIEAALNEAGEQILTMLSSEEMLAFDGLLTIEAQKHTAIAKRFYKAGPGQLQAVIASNLTQRAERGELKLLDANEAAEDLIALWQGVWPMERRFLQRGTPTRAQIKKKVAKGTRNFLALYGTGSNSEL
ncbi:TetR family transcriptional regulator [Erythrobacter sp. KY5]|uniref:TetR/AcrR family transcriptional regulator n=1 Tax=Erythrobacter sp. KY5 TaxID=2011159 RepID=UPI000DBF3280|nr:TetR/AcrR family transcriptional regulator [Erythrobacter sp. KY5]AWW74390.1 TetR family transcriptional regulator [Erythrobacter sp. KY5]